MKQPLITIITPSYNRAGMIETAIKSVLDQSYPHVEHIIIDGGSTDGTLDILKKYPHLTIVSEPDQGMYDALNKGIELSTGEIIGFLNTDDYYASGIFSKIIPCFSMGTVDAVAGLAGITRSNIHDAVFFQPAQSENRITHTVLEQPVFNAYFFSARIFHELGNFDIRYKIAADRDLMLRFFLGNYKTNLVDFPVYYYLQHSDSMTVGYTEAKFRNIADEHLLLSEYYLKSNSKFSRQLTISFIEMRTRDTIRVCAHCIRQKDLNGAWFYFKEGFRYNPFWVIRFLKHAIVHPIRQKTGLPYKSP